MRLVGKAAEETVDAFLFVDQLISYLHKLVARDVEVRLQEGTGIRDVGLERQAEVRLLDEEVCEVDHERNREILLFHRPQGVMVGDGCDEDFRKFPTGCEDTTHLGVIDFEPITLDNESGAMVVLEFSNNPVIALVIERVEDDLAKVVKQARNKESFMVGEAKLLGNQARSGCASDRMDPECFSIKTGVAIAFAKCVEN